jgi:hypothetical protein
LLGKGNTMDALTQIHQYIEVLEDERIVLLRNKEVLQWLFGDLSFLPPIEKKNKTADTKKYKVLEDEWGRRITKIRRPDLELAKQWTTCFGQHVAEELLMLQGKTVTVPANKNGYEPDREVDDAIWEVKTETFHTEGTAGEKILGCPFKYAEVPRLYGKPLRIVCLGGAEKACREQYGSLPGGKCSEEKKAFLDFYKSKGIEYVAATELLKSILHS